MGFDNNHNNVLDASEITNTEYVCNGEDASSHPFVVYTNPTPNETGVELDTVISAVFNTEMDPDTIDTSTFTVKDEGGGTVAGTVTYSGIVAVFNPTETWTINKKYTVNLSSTIKNESGIEMGYDHKLYFTIGKAAVKYMANGAESGTVPVDSNTYGTGETTTVLNNTNGLVKSGYTFIGWNTKIDGSGTDYWPGSPVTIDMTDIILYAKWYHGWSEQWVGGTAESSSFYAIASSSDGRKLTAVVEKGHIYTSTDSGVTWITRTSAGSRYWRSIASSSDGRKLAAMVWNGYIYTSSDSGDTWAEQTSAGNRNWYCITSSSDGNKLAAVVEGGYIYTSTDSGVTWAQQTSAGIRNWHSVASSSDGSKLAAVAEYMRNIMVYFP